MKILAIQKLFDKHSILNRLILIVISSDNLFGNFDKFRFSSMRANLTLSVLMSALKDTPTICFFVEIWPEMIIWSFCHTWYRFKSFPVTMT